MSNFDPNDPNERDRRPRRKSEIVREEKELLEKSLVAAFAAALAEMGGKEANPYYESDVMLELAANHDDTSFYHLRRAQKRIMGTFGYIRMVNKRCKLGRFHAHGRSFYRYRREDVTDINYKGEK